VAYERVKPT